LRSTLAAIPFDKYLRLGAEQERNCEWLLLKKAKITAIDLSDEMLRRAKEKINIR